MEDSSGKSLKFENRQIEPCLTRHAQGNHDGLYRQQGPADWILALELAWELGDHLSQKSHNVTEKIGNEPLVLIPLPGVDNQPAEEGRNDDVGGFFGRGAEQSHPDTRERECVSTQLADRPSRQPAAQTDSGDSNAGDDLKHKVNPIRYRSAKYAEEGRSDWGVQKPIAGRVHFGAGQSCRGGRFVNRANSALPASPDQGPDDDGAESKNPHDDRRPGNGIEGTPPVAPVGKDAAGRLISFAGRPGGGLAVEDRFRSIKRYGMVASSP